MIPQYERGTACGVKTSDSGQYMGGKCHARGAFWVFLQRLILSMQGELLRRWSSCFYGARIEKLSERCAGDLLGGPVSW